MSEDKIREINQISIKGQYDVIVIGAGVAGVSASLAAARAGSSVLLIEKSTVTGGLATLGLIAYYLPLCNGKGKKVIGGIAEELLHASIKYGYNSLPEEWKKGAKYGPEQPERYATRFSPPEFIIALDELLEKENIKILYDTFFSNCLVEEKICKYIITENKSGRQAYSAKMVIDTSGDSDVLYRAGVNCEQKKNYLAFWFYDTSLKK